MNLGLRPFFAFFSSIVTLFSGYICTFGYLWQIIHEFYIFPLLILIILKFIDKPKLFIFLTSFIIFIAAVAGSPQWGFYGIFAGFVYIISDTLTTHSPLQYRLILLSKRIGFYFSSLIIGGLMASFRILPTLQQAELSIRKGDFSPFEIQYLPPLNFLLGFLLPEIYLPKILSIADLAYIGILPLILSIIAFKKFFKDKRIFNLSIMAIIGLVLSFGKYSPLFWILQLLPGFRYFQEPERWLLITIGSLSLLSGFGFSFIIEEKKISIKLLKIIKWFTIITISGFLLSNLVFYTYKDKIRNWGASIIEKKEKRCYPKAKYL